MNELKEKLAALGLSEEQINGSIIAVSDYVKSRLPEDYRGVVDSLLKGESPDLSALSGGLLDKVKGMFGG
ncbi:DUF2267 domain-containing protein [Luteolibacter marinus]|uniref:DUF2267 domain-containing protein n=1 Tax=Luteolibacter marinus TaxID=2776705 RepID=UPI001865C80B|nr:DUF2267 domain-containing protein [Luteolibacter marinus]